MEEDVFTEDAFHATKNNQDDERNVTNFVSGLYNELPYFTREDNQYYEAGRLCARYIHAFRANSADKPQLLQDANTIKYHHESENLICDLIDSATKYLEQNRSVIELTDNALKNMPESYNLTTVKIVNNMYNMEELGKYIHRDTLNFINDWQDELICDHGNEYQFNIARGLINIMMGFEHMLDE